MYLVLRTETFAKLFFLISCLGLFVYAFIAFYTFHVAYSHSYLLQKYQNHLQGLPDEEDNLETGKNKKDHKYILIWSIMNDTINYYGEGVFPFLDNKCAYKNCYLTTNKYLLDNINDYDAIVFNTQTMKGLKKVNMPRKRSPHQKYIFYSMESADETPICNIAADEYFNLTCTYKLDSDIVAPFIEVRDFDGNVVAPKSYVKWETTMAQLIEEESDHLKHKSIAMAWIVNQCHTRSNILLTAKRLQDTFRRNSLKFDIYGCGLMQCPKEGCWKALERDYYFYYAVEDSNAQDYVTREVLKAYNYDAVPVVLGGADYHRFLPEGSYINAGTTSDEKLVALIDYIIRNPNTYNSFFRWKRYYTIRPSKLFKPLCKICQYLNDDRLYGDKRIKKNFRHWWYGKPLSDRCIPKGAESMSAVLSYVNTSNSQ